MNSAQKLYIKRPNTGWSENVYNGCLQLIGQNANNFFDSDSWPAKITMAVPFYHLLLAFIVLMTKALFSLIYLSVSLLL